MSEAVSTNPVSRGLRWAWPALGLFVVSLLLLGGWLADELIEGEHWSLDTAILLALRHPHDLAQPIGPGWLLQSTVDISALGGDTLLWLFGLAGGAWLLFAGKRAEAAWIALSLIGATVLNGMLKAWIARPRPELVPHLVHVTHASFPSGHAMVSAAIYLTLGLMLAEGIEPNGWRDRAARVAVVGFFAALAVLIGMSRVYLGVHWPSDVLAGWCFGTAWALLVWAANRWWHGRRAAPS
ncbi:MAG: phosphatase PAP2 family protein [Sphingomonas sp.]|uniref:phosphatase PAP2 family protein n=1 Tax=Sphingomonas sp. TaxID=28214 RepID=UPI001AC37DB8|nr:phosphatase PAP2 family protein [Sphingomonas sp.]MBN8807266.1 phosphatase PAP2 family protein [Sphingomonas sp.]